MHLMYNIYLILYGSQPSTMLLMTNELGTAALNSILIQESNTNNSNYNTLSILYCIIKRQVQKMLMYCNLSTV